MRMKALSPLVLGVVALCLALAATAAPRDPKGMVLRLSDLPTGFQVDGKPGYVSAAGAAAQSKSTTLAQYKHWGYVNGYEVNYKAAGELGALVKGVTNIESVTMSYATTGGAISSTADSRRSCERAPFTRLSLSATLGAESMLCTATLKSGSKAVRVYAVLWRIGKLHGEILTAGVDGKTSPTEAVKLAQKQAARMR